MSGDPPVPVVPGLVMMRFVEAPTELHWRSKDGEQAVRCPNCGWRHGKPTVDGVVVSWGLTGPPYDPPASLGGRGPQSSRA